MTFVKKTKITGLCKAKNHNIKHTTTLVAQLIGEEPWFDLCQQPLFQTAKTTLLLYDRKAISSNSFARSAIDSSPSPPQKEERGGAREAGKKSVDMI
jgi:hypothetical protein